MKWNELKRNWNEMNLSENERNWTEAKMKWNEQRRNEMKWNEMKWNDIKEDKTHFGDEGFDPWWEKTWRRRTSRSCNRNRKTRWRRGARNWDEKRRVKWEEDEKDELKTMQNEKRGDNPLLERQWRIHDRWGACSKCSDYYHEKISVNPREVLPTGEK